MVRRGAALQERSIGVGYVALHVAAMRGHKECVEILLKAGAPPHPRTRDGDTPKDLAKDNGSYDLATFLGKHFLTHLRRQGKCLSTGTAEQGGGRGPSPPPIIFP